MKPWPSRFRRLDDALADLPLDEPMLLSELDGFLTGILVCPDLVMQTEWLQVVWGTDESGAPPSEDPADVRWFADAVLARYNEIARDLGRGKLQPLFDIDERNGETLWDVWIDGFAEAMALRPESWAALHSGSDPETSSAISRIITLISVAYDESDLDSLQINALEERAPSDIIAAILHLHAVRVRDGGGSPAVPAPAAAGERPTKVGRNDPCLCGSGNKAQTLLRMTERPVLVVGQARLDGRISLS